MQYVVRLRQLTDGNRFPATGIRIAGALLCLFLLAACGAGETTPPTVVAPTAPPVGAETAAEIEPEARSPVATVVATTVATTVATSVVPTTEAATNTPEATAVPAETAVPTVETAVSQATFYYGIALPVTESNEIRSPDIVASQLQQIKALGANVTGQLFPADLTTTDWLNYLDVAQQQGISVLAEMELPNRNPDPANLAPVKKILDEVADHPALYGFIYLHEPWELFDNNQMHAAYQELKAAYPELRLAVFWSGQIAKAEGSRNPNKRFEDGLCDICIVNLKPYQVNARQGEEQGLSRMEASFGVIQTRDPDAELWSTAQIWAPPGGGGRGFRVANPDEMSNLFCTLQQQYPLRGFMWEVWAAVKANNVQTLNSPAMAPQQQAVLNIYQSCVQN